MHRLLKWLAAALAFITIAGSGDAFAAERRVALVVGNANYRNVSPLANTINDATAIASLFKKAGFDVVYARTDLGVVDFKRAVRDFLSTAQDASIAVFYYAGHGIEVGGVNYLIPVDAKLASDYDAEDEAVSLNRILMALHSVKRLRLVILDACRDNPFLGKMQRSVAMRASSQGLAKLENTAETLVAFAARDGATSFDGEGPNSPFTTALLKHIAEPGLDIRIALGRVRDDVLKTTGRRQEPYVYGSLGGDTLALVPAVAPAPAPVQVAVPIEPTAIDRLLTAQRDYELAERIGTRRSWEYFLGIHKTGYYAELAQLQLAKLAATPSARPNPIIPSTATTANTPSNTPVAPATAPVAVAPAVPSSPTSSAITKLSLPPEPAPSAQEPRVPVAKLETPKTESPKLEPSKTERDAAPAKSTPEPSTLKPVVLPITPLSPEAACQRDEERLARLRANPTREEVLSFVQELGCARLRPQLVRLRESIVGDVATAAASPTLDRGTHDRDREAARQREEDDRRRIEAQRREEAQSREQAQRREQAERDARPQQTAMNQDAACARDDERLAKLRAEPTRAAIEQFQRELGCERLRPQLQRLRESID